MRFSLIVITHHFHFSKRIFRKCSPAQQCCCSASALYLSLSICLSVSLAPLHYCLIAISAKQASSQNDYYELACVSSLCIMQSPCHALQQRLAHTHRRTRAHTEAQTDMLWHDTSTHTLQLSCKCLAPIVLVAVLLLPSKSVLKISP